MPIEQLRSILGEVTTKGTGPHVLFTPDAGADLVVASWKQGVPAVAIEKGFTPSSFPEWELIFCHPAHKEYVKGLATVTQNTEKNCFFQVGSTKEEILQFLLLHRGHSGIIFTTDQLWQRLGMEGVAVTNDWNEFVNEEVQWLLTETLPSGFKPNTRFVLFLRTPQDMMSFRAGVELVGKDGELSNCMVVTKSTPKQFPDTFETEIKKVLSGVFRLGQRASVRELISMLLGENRAYASLPTFGSMKGTSKRHIAQIIRTLFHKKLLREGRGVLSWTLLAHNVIKGKERVQPPTLPMNDVYIEFRKELAKRERVPPYTIFGDRLIAEMSVKKPKTAEEFQALPSITPFLWDRHGNKLLGAFGKIDAVTLFNECGSIKAAAEAMNICASSLAIELEIALREGKISVDKFVTKEKQALINESAAKVGHRISAIMALVPNSSYEEIRFTLTGNQNR